MEYTVHLRQAPSREMSISRMSTSTPTFLTIATEIRRQIFSYVIPNGVLTFVPDDDNPTEYRGMMIHDFQRQPLSLALTRTSKKFHGEFMDLFWKTVVVDLDNIIWHHNAHLTWIAFEAYSTPSYRLPPPRALPQSVPENAEHVTLTVDPIPESVICQTLEELAEWPRIQRIDFKADIYWPSTNLQDGNRRKRTWHTVAENLFGDDGPASHVLLNMSEDLDAGAL